MYFEGISDKFTCISVIPSAIINMTADCTQVHWFNYFERKCGSHALALKDSMSTTDFLLMFCVDLHQTENSISI